MARTPPLDSSFLKVLAGQPNSPPPIWLMRQAGRYLPEYREVRSRVASFLDICRTPELAAEVTLQPLRRFNLSAAIVFSDILIVPYALGQKLEFVEGEGPKLDPVRDGQAIARLDDSNLLRTFGAVYETVERVSSALPKDVPLIGFCGAPWTVASYMVAGGSSKEQAEARLWAYREPAIFLDLIQLLIDTSVEYLLGQVNAGADVLQIFESWAGCLSDDEFARWCIAPARSIVERVKQKAPHVPIIGFPRGSGPLAVRYAKEAGIDAIGCDATLPLDWIKDSLQPLLPVQGNLDPLLLVSGGSRLDARVKATLAELGKGPFIFNLGHGIQPNTPISHVERLIALVKGASA
jgi:uroporphyrinogen decarboxylase